MVTITWATMNKRFDENSKQNERVRKEGENINEELTQIIKGLKKNNKNKRRR